MYQIALTSGPVLLSHHSAQETWAAESGRQRRQRMKGRSGRALTVSRSCGRHGYAAAGMFGRSALSEGQTVKGDHPKCSGINENIFQSRRKNSL